MEDYLPDIYQKSIYAIDYDNLHERGIKCLLFNIDNTIVTYGSSEATSRLINLINDLKVNFKIVLFSDVSSSRMKILKNVLGCDMYHHPVKAKEKNIIDIMKSYYLEEPEMAIISDSLIRDIYLGNRVGITTILVNPISKNTGFFAHINRGKEEKVLRELRDQDLFLKGRYYDE